jgi:hypothetical protein
VVFRIFGLAIQVGLGAILPGREAAERPELVNEMRLIVIATFQRHLRPFTATCQPRLHCGVTKANGATKLFWRNTGQLQAKAPELARAQPGMMSEFVNANEAAPLLGP